MADGYYPDSCDEPKGVTNRNDVIRKRVPRAEARVAIGQAPLNRQFGVFWPSETIRGPRDGQGNRRNRCRLPRRKCLAVGVALLSTRSPKERYQHVTETFTSCASHRHG